MELRASTISIPAAATVRNCRPYGGWFRVGVRFAETREASKGKNVSGRVIPPVPGTTVLPPVFAKTSD